jgi:hypothetical protein
MNASIKVSMCIAVLGLLTFVLHPPVSCGESESHWVKCDIHAGPCRAAMTDTEVSLEISPRPVKAMQELTFTVSFAGKQPGAAPYIDLGMPGMNMGRNRVTLKPAGESGFEGKGVIVRCPSGRRTWKATVTAPNLGSVEFVFDVIY